MPASVTALLDKIRALEALVQSLEGKNGALESALVQHALEIELLQRKLYGTKSEKSGTSELQLLLEGIADTNTLQKLLDDANANKPKSEENEDSDVNQPGPHGGKHGGSKAKPKGRRDLSASKLPHVEVEITDPVLAEKGEVIGHDESRQLLYVRGGFRVLVKRVARYKLAVAASSVAETTVLAATTPPSLCRRSLCHSSVMAWLAHEKFAMGVPHHRLEKHLETEAEPLDRGTMCRYVEDLGGTLGSTVVEAMWAHARAECQVLSTDATGAAIQPEPGDGKSKQACRKGHFFTVVADRDHVLFHFARSHSSATVKDLFEGFQGYLQSDASSVYDVLDRGPPTGPALTLVGCWAHCRRYFFEAAVCKERAAVEGLFRIRAIYRAEAVLRELPPCDRKARRNESVRPLIDDFFAWANAARAQCAPRSLTAKALGYAANQQAELERVLLDGRLELDNTHRERALRRIVVGRKNWLFYGSDVHAIRAAALFSLIASCRLHGLDSLDYLTELARVLPHWPRERYLELAPFRWRATRERLNPDELAAPVGVIMVPPRG